MDCGERSRIVRPCTLMMVQNVQAKGQPREVSTVPKERLAKCLMVFGLITGGGASSMSTRFLRSWAKE